MSRQQDAYLALRRAGATMHTAAAQTGIGIAEARLIEDAIVRGELDLQSPTAGPAASEGAAVMAKKAKPGDSGVTNLTSAKATVKGAVPAIINLKKQRQALNEQIASHRANVEAAGVPKKALDHAIKMFEMDPKDREAFDEGFVIARDAIAIPVSRSLFDMLDERLDSEGRVGEKREPAVNGAIGEAVAARQQAAAPDAVTH